MAELRSDVCFHAKATRRVVAPLVLAVCFLLGWRALVAAQGMALPGRLDVTASGAAVYAIPIDVPPGTAGLIPKLAFEYNSQNGNGFLGMGWVLAGLPSITRCPRTLAQDGVRGSINYDANDRFCLDGQRLVAVSGAYGADGTEYRTEIESFSRIISRGSAGTGPAWFEVRTRSGQIIELGNTSDSRLLAQGKATARAWAASKIADRKGNYIAITYTNDAANGQIYPLRLDYTGNAAASLQPYNSVQFVYETRPDITPLYHAGSLSQTTQRLTSVQAFAQSVLVSDYRLAYDQSGVTGRSRLMSITLCEGSGACLPATDFAWQVGSTAVTVISNVAGQNGMLAGSRPYVSDFNGDGLADVLWDSSSSSTDPVSSGTRTLWTSSGGGSLVATTNVASQDGNLSGFAPLVADFNRDGRADVWWYQYDHTGSSVPTTRWTTTAGGFSVAAGPTIDVPHGRTVAMLADLNADNRADVGWGTTYFYSAGSALVSLLDIMLTQPDGSVTTTLANVATVGCTTHPATYIEGSSVQIRPFHGYDFNGDGYADLLWQRGTYVNGLGNPVPSSAGSCQSCHVSEGGNINPLNNPSAASWSLCYGKGDGTYPATEPNYDASFTSALQSTAHIGDYNGDGKDDILVDQVDANGRSTGSRILRLSKGDGTFAQISNPGGTDGTLSGYRARVGDFNGDGRADVLWDSADTNGLSTGSRMLWLSKGDGTFTVVSNVGGQNGTVVGYSAILGDFNGDGKTDILWDSRTGTDTRSTGTRVLWLSDGVAPDLITSVTTGLSASATFTYKPLTDASIYTRETTAADPLVDLQSSMQVLTRIDQPNGAGGKSSTTYTYKGAKLHLDGRAFLGFRQIAVTMLDTGIVETTTYRQDFPFTGLVAEKMAVMGGMNLRSTVNDYGGGKNLGGTRHFVKVEQTIASGADLDGSPLPTMTTSYQYDDYGNTTQIVEAFSDGHGRTISNAYTNDVANWLIGQLTNTTVVRQSPYSAPPIQSCALPWGGTLGHGQSVTAYAASIPPSGQTCAAIAEARTCAGATLSGSFTHKTCTAPPLSCAAGQTVTWAIGSNTCSANSGTELANGASRAITDATGPAIGSVSIACKNGTLNQSGANCSLPDTTPDTFTFTDVAGQPLNTLIASNVVIISGISASAPVLVSGDGLPQISIAGGPWGTSGSITNGQTLQVRLTSATTDFTTQSATVTVGSVAGSWSVTTVGSCHGCHSAFNVQSLWRLHTPP